MSDAPPAFKVLKPSPSGKRITFKDGNPILPDEPVVPFIEGDGTGRDIWRASVRVFDAAVAKAFGGKRRIHWLEVFCGDKALNHPGYKEYLPQDTLDAIRYYGVGIKGPLTTPIGGGIRSLNVALRQLLDLYACVRPVRYFQGAPSPVKQPEKLNIVLFRENTEDVYGGMEWREGTDEAKKLIGWLNEFMKNSSEKSLQKKSIRPDAGVGIKPISRFAAQRLTRRGIQYALKFKRTSVTLVHKGNIMKFTEGAFRDWGYELAASEFRAQTVTERETWILENKEKNANLSDEDNARAIEPGFDNAPPAFQEEAVAEVKKTLGAIWKSHGQGQWKKKLLVKDRIADSIFQQLLLRPDEYDVLCTPNLNGDYLSDAAAAQVGGLGIAPGGNIGDGGAVFEATHGTAPKYADKDQVNPGAVILSGAMMFEYFDWYEARDLIWKGLEKTLQQKRVTYDFERLVPGSTRLKCSEFASAIVENM
jgi:isocitrate dehydrogenase